MSKHSSLRQIYLLSSIPAWQTFSGAFGCFFKLCSSPAHAGPYGSYYTWISQSLMAFSRSIWQGRYFQTLGWNLMNRIKMFGLKAWMQSSLFTSNTRWARTLWFYIFGTPRWVTWAYFDFGSSYVLFYCYSFEFTTLVWVWSSLFIYHNIHTAYRCNNNWSLSLIFSSLLRHP